MRAKRAETNKLTFLQRMAKNFWKRQAFPVCPPKACEFCLATTKLIFVLLYPEFIYPEPTKLILVLLCAFRYPELGWNPAWGADSLILICSPPPLIMGAELYPKLNFAGLKGAPGFKLCFVNCLVQDNKIMIKYD